MIVFYFRRWRKHDLASQFADRKDLVSSYVFCFPVSYHMIVPQRTVPFKCRPMHVYPRAYVWIIIKRQKANLMVSIKRLFLYCCQTTIRLKCSCGDFIAEFLVFYELKENFKQFFQLLYVKSTFRLLLMRTIVQEMQMRCTVYSTETALLRNRSTEWFKTLSVVDMALIEGGVYSRAMFNRVLTVFL